MGKSLVQELELWTSQVPPHETYIPGGQKTEQWVNEEMSIYINEPEEHQTVTSASGALKSEEGTEATGQLLQTGF